MKNLVILFLFLLLSFTAHAKRMAAIKNNEIYYICNDGEQVGLPQDYDSIKEIPANLDESFLAVDSQGNLFQRQKTQEELDADIEQAIVKKVSCGEATINFISKNNIKKQLTVEQRRTMVQTYSIIFDLLKAGSLDIAKIDIQAIVADGTIVTEQDKTDVLAFIVSCE